ncbi:MAG: hypothetical protein MJ183_10035 [Treponemataceae bacterium]|nr:hypothetical protein [Treponemataceae bacterium]
MRKTLLFILLVLTTVLISCPNMGNMGTVIGVPESKKPMVAKVGFASAQLAQEYTIRNGDASRTLLPSMFKDNELALFIAGKGNSGKTLNCTKIKNYVTNPSGSNTSGSFTVELEPDVWELDLYATPLSGEHAVTAAEESNISAVGAKAVLVGHGKLDFTKTAGSVSFILATTGLQTNGYIDFFVALDGWTIPDAIVGIDAAVYDLETNQIVEKYTTAGNPDIKQTNLALKTETHEMKELDPSKSSDTTAVPAVKFGDRSKGVLPGTYSFVVTFAFTNGSYSASDDIIVLPGQTTNQTFWIPSLIGKAPDAPVHFTATYRDVDTEIRRNHYILQFDWTDSTHVEQYYEIQLADISGLGVSNDTFDWAIYDALAVDETVTVDGTSHTVAAVSATTDSTFKNQDNHIIPKTIADDWKYRIQTFGKDFYSSENTVRVDGSLARNNKYASVYVELGHQYAARIRAVNDLANSAWVKAQLTSESGVTRAGSTDFTGDTINIFRITYNLQGGYYETTANGVTTKHTQAEVFYHEIDDAANPTGIAYWDARYDAGTPAKPRVLWNESMTFDKWEAESPLSGHYVPAGNDYSADTYKGYNNSAWYPAGANAIDLTTKHGITEYTNNIEFYAIYKIMPATGHVEIYDWTQYNARKDWLTFTISDSTDGTWTGSYSKSATVSKEDAELSDQSHSQITFTFTVPDTTGTVFAEPDFEYDSVRLTINDKVVKVYKDVKAGSANAVTFEWNIEYEDTNKSYRINILAEKDGDFFGNDYYIKIED